jgi:hypothetical protein
LPGWYPRRPSTRPPRLQPADSGIAPDICPARTRKRVARISPGQGQAFWPTCPFGRGCPANIPQDFSIEKSGTAVGCGSAHTGGQNANAVAPAIIIAKYVDLSILNFFQAFTRKNPNSCSQRQDIVKHRFFHPGARAKTTRHTPWRSRSRSWAGAWYLAAEA